MIIIDVVVVAVAVEYGVGVEYGVE